MKKAIAIAVALFFCFVAASYYFRPSVIVVNKTAKVVYLYQSVGVQNSEPDLDQAQRSIRPVMINSGDSRKIQLPWQALRLDNGKLYLAWKVESRKASLASRTGGQIFNFPTDGGHCSYNLLIEGEKAALEPLNELFCFGRLSAIVNGD